METTNLFQFFKLPKDIVTTGIMGYLDPNDLADLAIASTSKDSKIPPFMREAIQTFARKNELWKRHLCDLGVIHPSYDFTGWPEGTLLEVYNTLMKPRKIPIGATTRLLTKAELALLGGYVKGFNRFIEDPSSHTFDLGSHLTKCLKAAVLSESGVEATEAVLRVYERREDDWEDLNINITDVFLEEGLLLIAYLSGNPHLIDRLLAFARPYITISNVEDASTLIALSAHSGDPDIIQAAIDLCFEVGVLLDTRTLSEALLSTDEVGISPIHTVAQSGNPAAIHTIVDLCPDSDEKKVAIDDDHKNALVFAVKSKNPDSVRVMASKYSSPEALWGALESFHHSAFGLAAETGELPLIEEMVTLYQSLEGHQPGALKKALETHDHNALGNVCRSGKLEAIEAFEKLYESVGLNFKAALEKVFPSGGLAKGARSGNLKCFKALAEKFTEAELQKELRGLRNNYDILQEALCSGNLEMVQTVFDKIEFKNDQEKKNAFTALKTNFYLMIIGGHPNNTVAVTVQFIAKNLPETFEGKPVDKNEFLVDLLSESEYNFIYARQDPRILTTLIKAFPDNKSRQESLKSFLTCRYVQWRIHPVSPGDVPEVAHGDSNIKDLTEPAIAVLLKACNQENRKILMDSLLEQRTFNDNPLAPAKLLYLLAHEDMELAAEYLQNNATFKDQVKVGLVEPYHGVVDAIAKLASDSRAEDAAEDAVESAADSAIGSKEEKEEEAQDLPTWEQLEKRYLNAPAATVGGPS